MSASDPSQVDAEELARNLSQASDEQLAELMSGEMRPLILDEIFNRMAEHFRPESARDVDAVIHWRIGGRPDGGADEYETVIRDGACEAHRGAGAGAAAGRVCDRRCRLPQAEATPRGRCCS